MEMSSKDGLTEKMKTLLISNDMPEIMKIFKDIILKSYGVKSPDGKRFIKQDEKGNPLYLDFMATEAYSNLYVELSSNAEEASKFINGIVPNGLEVSAEDTEKTMKQLLGDNYETIVKPENNNGIDVVDNSDKLVVENK